MRTIEIIMLVTLCQVTNGFIVQEPVANASLHELYIQLKSELATLAAKSANLMKEYNAVKLENTNLTNEIKELEKRATSAELELSDVSTKNTQLENTLTNIESQFSSMQVGLNNVSKFQYPSLNNKYSNLKNNFEILRREVGTASGTSLANSAKIGFSVSWPYREPYGVTHVGPLRFTNTFYDEYKVYNQTTGEFVCETPGLYFFSSMIIRQVGELTAASCYIKVNDMSLTYLEGYSFNSSYGSPSGTGTLLYHMKSGDTAAIGNCTNPKQIAGYSNFNGFLLDAD